MFSSVTDTHRQQHVVADLDSAASADGPAMDDLGAHVPEQRLGLGEGLPRVSPHHEGQGAPGRGVHSACNIVFSEVNILCFILGFKCLT